MRIDLKFGKGENNLEFSELQVKLIKESTEILSAVLNSVSFEKEVKNYTWRRKRGKTVKSFNHTSDSNETVLGRIKSGNDNFSTEGEGSQNVLGDKDLDVWLIPYITNKGVVGHTNSGTYKTWMNLKNLTARMQKYVNDEHLLKISIAQNILHEYCHNLGYQHKGNRKHKHNNKHSVPYGVGEIFSDIAVHLNETNIDKNSLDFTNFLNENFHEK